MASPSKSAAAKLTAEEYAEGLAALPLWSGDGAMISRTVKAPTFPTGIDLVRQAAAVAEEMNHHPDIDIRWRNVTFGLTTHDSGGVTGLDLALARRIDAIASDLDCE